MAAGMTGQLFELDSPALPACSGCNAPMSAPAPGCPYPLCETCWAKRIPVKAASLPSRQGPRGDAREASGDIDGSDCRRHQTEGCRCTDCEERAFTRTSPEWLLQAWGGAHPDAPGRREAFGEWLEKIRAREADAA